MWEMFHDGREPFTGMTAAECATAVLKVFGSSRDRNPVRRGASQGYQLSFDDDVPDVCSYVCKKYAWVEDPDKRDSMRQFITVRAIGCAMGTR